MRRLHCSFGSLLVAAGVLCTAGPAGAQGWNQPATYTLPEIDLSQFIDDTTGIAGVNDRQVELGGIGSDIWRGPGDGPGIYWMISDRGPNGEDPRTFPVYQFTPTILQVRTTGTAIEILQAIPIRGFGSVPVTGLPNLTNSAEVIESGEIVSAPNEAFFACAAGEPVSPSPNINGLDTEGLVRTKDGYFWVAEEYSPSLLKIDPNGVVVRRYFPTDLADYVSDVAGTNFNYPWDDSALSIPKIYGQKRKLNRGFEGLTLSPDSKTLYIALQSPLNNPTTAAGNNARNTRILAFDIATEQVVGEYVYRFQPAGEFPAPPGLAANRARDMKVSALSMLDQRRMLVLERTDFIAKVYLVDLQGATDILHTQWDDVDTSPTLEELVSDGTLEAAGITALPKTLVATFDSTQGYPQKIEGMIAIDGNTLVIANDNDFGVGAFTGGANCALTTDNGFESLIHVVTLPTPIK